MSGISTHVLDTSRGKPVPNVLVHLIRQETEIFSTRTNTDGRCPALLPPNERLIPGIYRLVFETGAYFENSFYPEVSISFTVTDISAHYHVPLLISPFGFTTYRGS